VWDARRGERNVDPRLQTRERVKLAGGRRKCWTPEFEERTGWWATRAYERVMEYRWVLRQFAGVGDKHGGSPELKERGNGSWREREITWE
jgi:hypothetical protein